MKRGSRKFKQKRSKKSSHLSSKRRFNSKKNTRRHPVRKSPVITDPRVVRALGAMRREGILASQAARHERMKLKTFRERAGRYLYRSGPGKPWKARGEDQLAVSMTLLTSQGRVDVVVRNSRERRLLHQYESALRAFRAGEDGAEAALKAFKGKSVGGHMLIADPSLIIQLEEAGQLDFESLYSSFGGRS